MTTEPTSTATTIVCVTTGHDVAFVQRYFTKRTDTRCMHGLTMYQNCDACRKITGRRFPDAAQVAGLCDDGSCVDDGVEYVY